jgi:aspartyl/asparaginyl beta-hydroxylase (cupin superfamily)
VIRASQTENASEDRIGVLNRIFSVACHVRLVGERIKSRSKLARYTLKWLIIGGLLYWIFA